MAPVGVRYHHNWIQEAAGRTVGALRYAPAAAHPADGMRRWEWQRRRNTKPNQLHGHHHRHFWHNPAHGPGDRHGPVTKCIVPQRTAWTNADLDKGVWHAMRRSEFITTGGDARHILPLVSLRRP